jgi:putative heme-binding domain-containing protein
MVLSFAPAARAQRELTNIPKPDVRRELAEFKLGDGLEINLFAADPMIAKPIQMNWDHRGRLWVASSSVYPQIKPGQTADDKIVVLEDADGDGKADKHTVFADGLLIPTGVLPDPDGCYVANSTELLYLRDNDGDGKADDRTVVLTGFGSEDTHHILHTFRWGVGGHMFINQSIYIHTHLETSYGPRSLLGGGIWQYRPTTNRAEVFARGFVNSWGHAFDYWGQSLCTDGAYGEGVNHAFPGAAFVTAVNAPRILRGLSPGQPKHCGLEVISSGHFPADWQGQYITNDFRGNRVNRFELTPQSSSYTARQMPDVVSTKNVAFRPVDVRIGPDGALYIADWYNPIIQHGEVDFRDPRRDHVHGRIWRITHTGRPLVKRPEIAKSSVEELLALLKSPEALTRQNAKLQLRSRKLPDVLPKLASWWCTLDPKAAGFEHRRLEALWTYQTLDVVEPSLLNNVLGSSEPFARAAAVRVLSEWRDRIPNSSAMLAKLATDEHPRVRLEAVSALREVGDAAAVQAALAALDKEVDSNLDYALWLCCRETQAAWLPAFQAGTATFGGDFRKILFALKATEAPEAVGTLIRMLERRQTPAADLPAVLEHIGKLGTPEHFDRLVRLCLEPPVGTRLQYLQALEAAAANRNDRPSAAERMTTLLANGAADEQRIAARLVGRWRVGSGLPELRTRAAANATEIGLRRACIDGLGFSTDAQDRDALLALARKSPDGIREFAVRALARNHLPRAAEAAAGLFADASAKAIDIAVVLDPFLQSKDGPPLLAAALGKTSIPADRADAALRVVTSSGREQAALVAAFRKAGNVGGVMTLTPEQKTVLLADVARIGDPVRGEAVYRREALQCQKCHAIGGVGGDVGPDLLSLGSSAQPDYIVESLLEPSMKIKEGFHTVTVVKDDGAVVSGLLVAKTDREIRLRDANAVESAIPVGRIESQKQSPVSLMPQDLLKSTPRGEFVDLVRFLSELGKDGAYKIGPQRYVRRWQVLAVNPTVAHLISRVGNQALVEGQPGLEWKPAYSLVDGSLPVADVPVHRHFMNANFGFVRCELDAAVPGKVGLKWNDPVGVKLWLAKTEQAVKPITELELPKGVSTVTLLLDLNARKTPIRAELIDLPGSNAKAAPAVGK